jgi:DNA-binding response OmpR family regulator
MNQILIIEDDISINNGIVLALKQSGYQFTQCFTLAEAMGKLKAKDYQLILLDINLPDGSGYEVCKEVRRTSEVPILIITANDLEIDEVTGLQLGADDYITKPFSLMVLRARVEALLRRSKVCSKAEIYSIDDYRFDFTGMNFSKKGNEIVLSRTEQKLLRELVVNRGNIVKRDTLLDRLWTDAAEFVDENALSVSISRLRNKLEDAPAKPKYIKTVYGIGYTWAEKKV